MALICEVPGCGEELSEGTGSKGGPMLCKQCYSAQFYWRKQGHQHIEYRRWQLSRFLGRFDHFGTYMSNFREKQRKKQQNLRHKVRKKTRR